MAGTDSRFDASAFRDAIHFAMQMGLPTDPAERVTFRWKTERTFAGTTADSTSNPFNWTETAATTDAPADVLINAAVEIQSSRADSRNNRMGEFDNPRAIVTVLDTEFVQLTQDGRFADLVIFNDATWEIQFVAPPIGLFNVTIYQVHAQAVDEA